MTITFDQALAHKQELEATADYYSLELRKFPKLKNGMTPDDVKNSNDYKLAKLNYDAAAISLREYNSWFLKNFDSDYRTWRRKNRKIS